MESKQLIDTLRAAMLQALANTHTIAIAQITKVDAKTINCTPVINRVIDGTPVGLPEFVEVPPIFLQGGSSYTAHPITVGDYCLLLFSERCFDQWYAGRDYATPPELRMHDYSDGFALVGVNPLAAAITIPTVIQQTGDTNQDGDYTHQGKRTQTGDHVQTGDRTLTGDVTHTGAYNQTGDMDITGALGVSGLATVGSLAITGSLSIGGSAGVSGTFTSNDGKTITVTNGIITAIV
jgi:hypothetical protein